MPPADPRTAPRTGRGTPATTGPTPTTGTPGTPGTGQAQPQGRGRRPAQRTAGTTAPRPSRISDADKDATRTAEALKKALAYSNRIADGAIVCPGCNDTAVLEKKFKLFPDGGWKHFSSGGCHGDAISVLQAPPLSLDFVDAVCLLVGKPTRATITPPTEIPDLAMNAFRAKVDIEVYNGILTYGRKALDGAGVKAAQEFYGQWHISPEAVAASGAVYITDPKHFAEKIAERFGVERLLACGLFKTNDKGEAYCLVSKKWPVVEPHRHPATGDVVNIQFRASNEQYQRYLRHKAGELPYDGNQKFINLRGIPPTAYIGCGLDSIDPLPEGSTVYIVEGFKDRLAAVTTGVHAYGIPGVDFRPNDKICRLLSRHKVVIALDGDKAGRIGVFGSVKVDEAGNVLGTTQGLLGYLHEKGVDATYYQIPGGMDVTDRLLEKHARAGCTCPACQAVAARPAAPATSEQPAAPGPVTVTIKGR